ncbi:hypothetical protein HKI87_06g42200 [Chloropicon roscoffensis]|uniref:F-box domain-containing protein n=1 Tax=Chloropicon roscoffensis TaxID=1461544 RepID=A0AAX4P960_9CHLO
MGGSDAAGPSAKRAKTSEPEEEEEDPLVRRREELILQGASAAESLRAVCAKLQAKNEKLLGRLPPELWKKILDENLHQNDLVALAMTCRFFRDTAKILSRKLETNLSSIYLLELLKSGKMASHSLGWFQWVCDTFETQPGFKMSDNMRFMGAVREVDLFNYAAFQGSVEILRWLMEEKGCKLNVATGLWAGWGGSVEVLGYLEERGYEFFEAACAGAAEGGHLKALKFLRGLDPPCPWNKYACFGAAEEGRLEVLKWARSQDPPCPWVRSACREKASKHGHEHVIKWIDQQEDESDTECSVFDEEYSDFY